ncbi:unnamed protein product [Withania somnifera]
MKSIATPHHLFRHSSTPRSSQLSYSFRVDQVSSSHILEGYPDIKTLMKLHFKIIFDSCLCNNSSLAIKLMRAYAACGQPNVTRQLFGFVYKHICKRDVSPDNYTFPCVVKACFGSDNLRVGLQIHPAVAKRGLNSDLFVGNLEFRRVLDEMTKRDVVSWNSMVVGYAQNGKFDDMFEVCKEMNVLGHKPNAGTMADIFMNMVKKDLVPWNVMIAVYVKNFMPNEAVELCLQMETCGTEPDAITFARGIMNLLRKGLRPNLSLENALVDMYARCGCLTEARKMFEGLEFRDVLSCTSLISAYGKSGQGRDGAALFSQMLEFGLQPDSIAFVSVLSSCSHAGLLLEGKHYYKLMKDKYKIVPRLEHYACMVDLIGRAGYMDEVFNFIKQMPIEANERIWGALLGACRVYNDMDIGLVAADNLFELAPKQSGYYMLTVRSLMKRKGIKKIPGVSNVELNNMVHTFLAGDTSHPQSKEIYKELRHINRFFPLRVEEEDKENHLVVHSEKMTIVFAIMNRSHGTPIRITKILVVCGDCHIEAKLISIMEIFSLPKLYLIIVRDANRYHHFQNGVCSCSDYW